MKLSTRPARNLLTCLSAVFASACLTLSAAPVADEIKQMNANYDAGKWELVRDQNMQLLTTRLDELSASDANWCYRQLVTSCRKIQPVDVDSVVKGLDAVLKKPDLKMSGFVADTLCGATWTVKNAGKSELAAEMVDKTLAYTKGEFTGMRAMYYIKARHLQSHGKTIDARNFYSSYLSSAQCVDLVPYSLTCDAADAIAAAAKEDGDWDRAALEWVRAVAAWRGSDAAYDSNGEDKLFRVFRAGIAPNVKDSAKVASTATLAASCIPASVRAPQKCHELQKAIVLLYVQAKRREEALLAARTLYQTCPPDHFDAVVDYIADILKRMDGSIARANRFLDFVKFGTVGPDGKAGTDDDTVNPFPADGPEAPQDVALAYRKAIAGEWKDTWEDKRCLATLYRYMDEPKRALKCLSEAFVLAPMKPEPLQLVAGDMANVLIQLTGNPADGDQLAKFLKFGREGRDGKPGTDDDLTDPREPYTK
jgi:tetratricopeptide (TPR) repeat protein